MTKLLAVICISFFACIPRKYPYFTYLLKTWLTPNPLGMPYTYTYLKYIQGSRPGGFPSLWEELLLR